MKIFNNIAKVTYWAAMGTGLVLMLFTVAAVVARYIVKNPILGDMEVSQLLLAMIISLGFIYATVTGSNIKIELLYSRFPSKARILIDSLGYSFGLVFFALIAWKGTEHAIDMWREGEVTGYVHAPIYAFRFLLAFVAFFLCLTLAFQIVNKFTKAD